jgi:hypothetical protein
MKSLYATVMTAVILGGLSGCASTQVSSPVAQAALQTTSRIAMRRFLSTHDVERTQIILAKLRVAAETGESVTFAALKEVAYKEIDGAEGLSDLDRQDARDLVTLFSLALEDYAIKQGLDPQSTELLITDFIESLLMSTAASVAP